MGTRKELASEPSFQSLAVLFDNALLGSSE